MELNSNAMVAIALIGSLTLIGSISLIRNTDTNLTIQLGKDRIINLTSQETVSDKTLDKTKVDCLPIEDNNSQPLICEGK